MRAQAPGGRPLTAAGGYAPASDVCSSPIATWTPSPRKPPPRSTPAWTAAAAAEQQRLRAEANFRQAFRAVGDFARVSKHPLFDTPALRPLRFEARQAILRYYQEFVRQGADDPVLLRELAEAHLQANVVLEEGDEKAAAAEIERAVELYERLLRRRPDDPSCLEPLARACQSLGDMRRRIAQPGQALRSYERARELNDRLAAAEPVDAMRSCRSLSLACTIGELRYTLGQVEEARRTAEELQTRWEGVRAAGPDDGARPRAWAWNGFNLGHLYYVMGRRPAALAAFEQGRALLEKLPREQATPFFLKTLAMDYYWIGKLRHGEGDRGAARQAYQRAAEVLEELVGADPLAVGQRRDLGAAYYNIGRLFAEDGQLDQALALYRRSLSVREALCRDYPHVVNDRSDLAGTWFRIGQVRLRRGDTAAGDAFMEALRLQRAVFAQAPWERQRRALSRSLRALAGLQRTRGEVAAALATLGEDEQLWPDQPDELCQIARALSLCIPDAPPPDRSAVAGRALDVLRRAFARGFRDVEQARRDPDLAAVRQHPGFAELVNGVQPPPPN